MIVCWNERRGLEGGGGLRRGDAAPYIHCALNSHPVYLKPQTSKRKQQIYIYIYKYNKCVDIYIYIYTLIILGLGLMGLGFREDLLGFTAKVVLSSPH